MTFRTAIKSATLVAAGLLLMPSVDLRAQEAAQQQRPLTIEPPATEAVEAPAPKPAKRDGRLQPDTVHAASPNAGQAPVAEPSREPGPAPATDAAPTAPAPAQAGAADGPAQPAAPTTGQTETGQTAEKSPGLGAAPVELPSYAPA